MNIREVARLAGVSPATVSRVINGTASVSEDKRARVLRAIAETEFVPNEVARTLFKGSSKTIGLLIPSMHNPYFMMLAAALDEQASRRGYRLQLQHVGYDFTREQAALQQLQAGNADGVILVPGSTRRCGDWRGYSMPMVVVDSDLPGWEVPCIYSDHYQGARMAMEHLVDCGCREIVLIRGPQSTFSGLSRYRGYQDYCLEYGICPKVVDCDYDFQAGLAMTEALLSRYPEVDGILACNDLVAISTYKILHKRKISVPDQVKLMGFDDIPFSGLMSPELSTIRQPVEDLAELAMELVLRRDLCGKEERHVLPVTLVPRETTGHK